MTSYGRLYVFVVWLSCCLSNFLLFCWWLPWKKWMHVCINVKCVCCLFLCLIAFTRKHRLTILSWDFGFRHVAICNSVALSGTLIRGSPILLGFPPFVDYLSRIFFRYPLSPLSFKATIKLWRAIHSSCNGRLNLVLFVSHASLEWTGHLSC